MSATAVLAFRPDATRIILAADSALASTLPNGSVRLLGGECKIARAGQWWFASGAIESAKGLSVTSTVAQAVSQTASMLDALNAIQREYQSQMLPIILRLDSYFEAEFAVDRPMIEVLIAGMDGGELKLGFFGALLKSQHPRELVAGGLVCPGALCDSPGRVLHGASVGGVIPDLLVRQPRPAWLERGDAAAARRLIGLQIARTPHLVKGPIDVLELTTAGARWINRDARSACPAIR